MGSTILETLKFCLVTGKTVSTKKKKEMRKKRKMDNGAPTEFLRNQTERKAQRVREYLDRSWRQDGLLETLLALHTERRE